MTDNERAEILSQHFTLLGHDAGIYYYLPVGSGQVVALKVSQHVEAEFIGLCPDENVWRSAYGGKEGVGWKWARADMINQQHKIGIYDQARVRGCGAWWDGGRAVIHLGDRLISDGKELPLSTPSHHIYQKSIPWNITHENPLSADEARKVLEICTLIPWDKPINARYLAGWLANAPICGALPWRPHVHIVGAADSGKSWIFREIISKLVGSISVATQGTSTESSIRQSLNSHAKPVIFDEAEAEDQRGQDRMDGILELARAASTDDSPPIRKGSPGGVVTLWYIRTAILFSSVSYAVVKKTDERRITALGLVRDGNKERFRKLEQLCSDTLTPEFCNRFLARSLSMIGAIRENARVFSIAVAGKTGSQGTGDQLGTLLAGAYSLWSDTVITAEEARIYIDRQDWTESKTSSEETDELQCLARILQAVLKVPSRAGPIDRSIADLIGAASERASDPILDAKTAQEALGRHGMRGDPDGKVISVSHSAIGKILADTKWSRNWGRTLRRIPGSQATTGTVPFGSTRSRGVEIPYAKDPDASEEVVEAEG